MSACQSSPYQNEKSLLTDKDSYYLMRRKTEFTSNNGVSSNCKQSTTNSSNYISSKNITQLGFRHQADSGGKSKLGNNYSHEMMKFMTNDELCRVKRPSTRILEEDRRTSAEYGPNFGFPIINNLSLSRVGYDFNSNNLDNKYTNNEVVDNIKQNDNYTYNDGENLNKNLLNSNNNKLFSNVIETNVNKKNLNYYNNNSDPIKRSSFDEFSRKNNLPLFPFSLTTNDYASNNHNINANINNNVEIRHSPNQNQNFNQRNTCMIPNLINSFPFGFNYPDQYYNPNPYVNYNLLQVNNPLLAFHNNYNLNTNIQPKNFYYHNSPNMNLNVNTNTNTNINTNTNTNNSTSININTNNNTNINMNDSLNTNLDKNNDYRKRTVHFNNKDSLKPKQSTCNNNSKKNSLSSYTNVQTGSSYNLCEINTISEKSNSNKDSSGKSRKSISNKNLLIGFDGLDIENRERARTMFTPFKEEENQIIEQQSHHVIEKIPKFQSNPELKIMDYNELLEKSQIGYTEKVLTYLSNLNNFSGSISSYICSHKGSKDLQKKVTHYNTEVSEYMIQSFLNSDTVDKVMTDPYANYIFQKAIPVSRSEIRIKVIKVIRDKFVAIAKNVCGSHSLQCLAQLESRNEEETSILQKVLTENCTPLSIDQNAVHIMLKSIQSINEDKRHDLNEEIIKLSKKLVFDPYGVCVVS